MELRRVVFNKWIPQEYIPTEKGHEVVKGTGCWQKDFENVGFFHQWASAYEEFETGAGNYTVAIVEVEDRTIEQVLPSNLKFVGLFDLLERVSNTPEL